MNSKKHKTQKGSALLLTLGILSLLLVIAMSFAFSSRTTRQVAKVNADQVKARLLAESGLTSVLTFMKQNMEDKDPDNPYFFAKTDSYLPYKKFPVSGAEISTFVSRGNAAASSTESQDLETYLNVSSHLPLLGKMIDSSKKLVEIFSISDSPGINDLNFVTVFDDSATNQGFLGRIAYIVFEEGNKIDINQALTLKINSDNRPFVKNGEKEYAASLDDTPQDKDFIYEIAGTNYNITESNTLRLGLNMQELQTNYLGGLDKNTTSSETTYIPWLSYKHLSKSSTHFNTATDILTYTFFSGEDIEAYWKNNQAYQRFDITGVEWDPHKSKLGWSYLNSNAWEEFNTTDYSAKQTYANKLIKQLCISSERKPFYKADGKPDEHVVFDPSNSDDDNHFGIPHLHSLPQHQREQVAANMVDFCDSDDYATLPSGTTTNNLLENSSDLDYCGNERVPYFNEVAVLFSGTRVLNADDPDNPKYRYSLSATINVELLQLYANVTNSDKTPAGQCEVRIYFDKLCCKNAEDEINMKTSANGFVNSYLPISFSYPELDGVKFHTETKTIDFENILFPLSSPAHFEWIISKITMVSYETGHSEYIYDTAWTNDDASGECTPIFEATRKVATWEVSDSRVNHLSANWKCRVGSGGKFVEYSDEGEHETIGKTNSNSDVNIEEPAPIFEDGETFSTAYIPNEPFANFWELGAVHRGEPFRTIDLLGDDSEIVDQIKIGTLKKHKGTYNINGRNPLALEAFAKNLDITKNYNGVSANDTATFNKDNIPTAWHTRTFKRSSAAATFKEINSNVPKNDREAEAFFARTVPFLTTRNDRFSIVVVAQLLKELPGVTSSNWSAIKPTVNNPTEFGGKYYSIYSTHRIIAHVTADAWKKDLEIYQVLHLED